MNSIGSKDVLKDTRNPRRKDQRFTFLSLESPVYTWRQVATDTGTLEVDDFVDFFKWTMSYRKDADLSLFYGSVKCRHKLINSSTVHQRRKQKKGKAVVAFETLHRYRRLWRLRSFALPRTRLEKTMAIIDGRQFTAKQLADYLKKLNANSTLYNVYFDWKENYEVESGQKQMTRHAICDLCRKLFCFITICVTINQVALLKYKVDSNYELLKYSLRLSDIGSWFIKWGDFWTVAIAELIHIFLLVFCNDSIKFHHLHV